MTFSRTISKNIFIVMDKDIREEVNSAMKKRKLNYRFHNPNTAEVTADYLLKILIEANASKVEQAIQEAANELPNEPKHDGGCPA